MKNKRSREAAKGKQRKSEGMHEKDRPDTDLNCSLGYFGFRKEEIRVEQSHCVIRRHGIIFHHQLQLPL